MIRIRGADPELSTYLKDLLTTLNPKWITAEAFGRWTGEIPKYLYQFQEHKDYLLIPRGMLEHLLLDLGREWEIEDLRVSPAAEKAWPENDLALRPKDQEPAIRELLQHDNGFLSAPAGSGKTIMGLEACRRLGHKALWLTHRNELKEQAIEEAVEKFGLNRKEIGVLHGPKWKVGPTLTIGMTPTLVKRDLTELAEEFGTVIIDEAHHVPSSSFLKVIINLSAKHIYGLTATAYRSDKLDNVMFNAVGPKVAEIEHVELFEEEHLMKPIIRMRHTGWCPPSHEDMEYHDLMEAMVTSDSRNQVIVNDVLSECRPGNACIVLVDRTTHAEVLTALLKKQGIRCDFAVASVNVKEDPKKKRKKKKKRPIPKKVRDKIIKDFKDGDLQVLVTTYDLLMEGFNYKPLNRLFLASPIKWKGNVIQALGRIQRTAVGKTNAIAYDYVDELIPMFVRQAETRLIRVYKEMEML